MLADINGDCMRMSMFEGEYRWHHHPDSDELFLVVQGRLQIDFAENKTVELAPWQFIVVPAGTVHRTRAIGRTVIVTFEMQGGANRLCREAGLMSELVGYVAAALTTISFVPQATRALRTRNTASISLGMYMLFTSGAACWLAYGIVIGSWPVILSNAIACLLPFVILMLKLRHG